MDPYNPHQHYLLHAGLVVIGIVIGALSYAAIVHLVFDLSTNTATDTPTPVIATNGYAQIETTFAIPIVGEIEGLSGGVTTDLPEEISIQLPLSVVSQEYIDAFAAMLNDANTMEVQVRDRLPQALYALQEAAEAGDMAGAFYAVVEARQQAESLKVMVGTFETSTAAFAAVTGTADPAVAAQSNVVVERSKAVVRDVNAFADHALELAVPAPPSQEQIDKLEPLAVAFDKALEEYALALQRNYEVIKSTAGQ